MQAIAHVAMTNLKARELAGLGQFHQLRNKLQAIQLRPAQLTPKGREHMPIATTHVENAGLFWGHPHHAAAGLRLRPRDAAKIGQLVLNKGAWGGKQIVSAKWIEQSVTPRFQAIGMSGGLCYYGQQWWMGRTLSGDKDVKWIAAQGLGGQRIFIIPELDLVMAMTSGLYSSPRQGNAPLDILANYIIPSVRDNTR